MATIFTDFPLASFEDGLLNIALSPPTPIGGWSLQYQEAKCFSAFSGLVLKTCASGFGGGVSGITVTDSGAGRVSIRLYRSETSGRVDGNYAWRLMRMDSGFSTNLAEGYRLCNQ